MAALQARHVLEGQEVGGHVVDCGWLKEGSHQLSDLDSKVCKVKSNVTNTQSNDGKTRFLPRTKMTL